MRALELAGGPATQQVLVNEGMVVRREPGARFALLAAFKFCPGARTNLAIIVLSQQCAAREPYRMRRHRAFSGVRTPQPCQRLKPESRRARQRPWWPAFAKSAV